MYFVLCVRVYVLLTCPRPLPRTRTLAPSLREGGAHFVVVVLLTSFSFAFYGRPPSSSFFFLVAVAVAPVPFVSWRTLLLLHLSAFARQRVRGLCAGVMASGVFARRELAGPTPRPV